MLLLTAEKSDGKYPAELITVRFRGDPRLADFRTAKKTRLIKRGKDKGRTIESESYEFFDRHLKSRRPATISGIKLIFRLNHDGSPRAAYLCFTCNVDDVPLTQNAKAIQWSETGEVTKKGKKRKTKSLPDGLIACAVDLGLRNLGFATLARYENNSKMQVLRSRNIWLGHQEEGGRHPKRWAAGADLAHIGQHKYKIRRQIGRAHV